MVLFLYNRQVEGLLCGLVVVFVCCRSLGWRFGVSGFCCGCVVIGVPFFVGCWVGGSGFIVVCCFR